MNLIKLSACLICLGSVISGISVMAMENDKGIEKCIEKSREDKMKEVYEQEIASGKSETYAKMYAFLATFNDFQTEKLRREAAEAYERRLTVGISEPFAREYVRGYLRQYLKRSTDYKTGIEINDNFLELFEKYALKGLSNKKSQVKTSERQELLKRKSLLPKAQEDQKKQVRQYYEEPCIKRVASISNIASIIEEIQAKESEERERLKKTDKGKEESKEHTEQCSQEVVCDGFKKFDSISSIFAKYDLEGLSEEEIQAKKLKDREGFKKISPEAMKNMTFFDMEPVEVSKKQLEGSKKQGQKKSDDNKTETTERRANTFEEYVSKGLPKRDTQSKFFKKTDGDASSNS